MNILIAYCVGAIYLFYTLSLTLMITYNARIYLTRMDTQRKLLVLNSLEMVGIYTLKKNKQ